MSEEKRDEVTEVIEDLEAEFLKLLVERINSVIGDEAIISSKLNFNHPQIEIDSSNWTYDLAKLLRDDEILQFNYMSCLSGVDYEDRMEVVYQFNSISLDKYLMLKVITNRDNPTVISVKNVWNTADWHEREAYDLLGITFTGHPNLTRILLQDEWEGHPLRKDYQFDKKELGLE